MRFKVLKKIKIIPRWTILRCLWIFETYKQVKVMIEFRFVIKDVHAVFVLVEDLIIGENMSFCCQQPFFFFRIHGIHAVFTRLPNQDPVI